MEAEDELKSSGADERPPFGTWVHWYLVVLLTLVVLVVLFYSFTRAFQ